MRSLLFLLLMTNSLVHAEAITLKDAFQAARQNMEALKRSDASIEQREEQKNRARAGLLPTVNGFANYTRIDPPETAGFRAFTLKKQYSLGVRLIQPLVRGGVLGALDVARENILLAEFQKEATDINLYQFVINAYYNLKISQSDVKNLATLLSYSKERVSEIRERSRIGRSRRGELVEAEAQLYTSESQYQAGLRDLEKNIKNFEFLTNKMPGDVAPLSEVPKLDGSLEVYLSKLQTRPDILARQQEVKVAKSQIEISKGSHYPSVDLVGNYYIDRTGVLASSEWDAGIVVSVPFYQGGGVQAQVREAVATKRIAELNSHESIRTAERELEVLYQNYLQIQAQLEALKKALAKAEEAYKLNKKDYNFGLVTNLDVLQSLNVFVQTKRSYDSLYAFAHMTHKSLEASIGVLP